MALQLLEQRLGSPSERLGDLLAKFLGLTQQLARMEISDAERAGQRLLVFSQPVAQSADSHPARELTWDYQIIGEKNGMLYGDVIINMPSEAADLPMEYFGLGLQIALNGGEACASDAELTALDELAELFKSCAKQHD